MQNPAHPNLTDEALPVENDLTPTPEVLDCAVENDLEGLTAYLFHGESQKVREDAALAIGMMMGESAVEAFIELFSQEDRHLRLAASWGLSAVGAPAVTSLIAALAEGDTPTRTWAAYTLGSIGHSSAESPLAGALEDENPQVRWWAGWALDQILQRQSTCSNC
ncbi:HEAT repeat protein [Methanofollis sp. W23]|uniref:HEAT repeat domain-containing protein n=1 Tax=Methanofollis sp. W23 TaxID=2817849 RepID=UPI001AE81B84|nr:HEAT repeat domain-containing protein [Methanofollis sp. W23]MBP2145302.1 HEAT repeat protein [Methanofollis sp. W23]